MKLKKRGLITRLILAILILLFPAYAFSLDIKSGAFDKAGRIPSKYSCDGENISPDLSWSGIPEGTKSLALICSDPDAPSGSWTHWVMFNISKDKRGLPEDIPKKAVLDDGSAQGMNDFGKTGYAGPCPPGKTPHRYFFTLYCIDSALTLSDKPKKADVLKAIEGHIIAETETFGVYGR